MNISGKKVFFLILIAVVTFFVVIFVLFRYQIGSSEPSVSDVKKAIIADLQIKFPNASSFETITKNSLPPELAFLIIPDSKKYLYQTVKYNTGSSGYYLEYIFSNSLFKIYSQTYSLFAKQSGWKITMSRRTDSIAVIEAQNSMYKVQVIGEMQNPTETSFKIQIIKNP